MKKIICYMDEGGCVYTEETGGWFLGNVDTSGRFPPEEYNESNESVVVDAEGGLRSDQNSTTNSHNVGLTADDLVKLKEAGIL